MARRIRRKRTTVLLFIPFQNYRESTHRGETLQQALKIAERSRLPASCSIQWGKMQKLSSTAGADGKIVCSDKSKKIDGERVQFISVRTNPKGFKGTKRK